MYRTRIQKISFSDTERYIKTNSLDQLGRSLEQELHYAAQICQLKREWASVSDFILHDKFEFVRAIHVLFRISISCESTMCEIDN